MDKIKEKIQNTWKSFKGNRKYQIIALVAVILILIAVGSGYAFFRSKKTTSNENSNVNTSSQNEEKKESKQEFPIAMIIENLSTIRSLHEGLSDADVVYEALAEGGITRFLVVYTKHFDLSRIGPIRSARHYYVDLAEEFHGFFGHVGGSPQSIGVLSSEDYLKDLNQFANARYYWRDTSIGAPHNVFTSTELMNIAKRDSGIESDSGNYESWSMKKDLELEERPTSQNIKINFSSSAYQVEYKYNREVNIYQRFNGGEEHKDRNGTPITPANIIVQYVETSLLEPATGRLDIKTIGEGKSIVFRDGQAIEATWKKTNRGDRTKFYDSENKEIKLNKGATWVELVPSDRTVEYSS